MEKSWNYVFEQNRIEWAQKKKENNLEVLQKMLIISIVPL